MQIDATENQLIPSNGDAASIAIKVAEYAGRTSGYLQAHSASEMIDDANRLIRRFPEHALLVATAAGLLAGFAIRRK